MWLFINLLNQEVTCHCCSMESVLLDNVESVYLKKTQDLLVLLHISQLQNWLETLLYPPISNFLPLIHLVCDLTIIYSAVPYSELTVKYLCEVTGIKISHNHISVPSGFTLIYSRAASDQMTKGCPKTCLTMNQTQLVV